MIEFKRYQILYDHWAVYVGEGFVVHVNFDSHGRVVIKKRKNFGRGKRWGILTE